MSNKECQKLIKASDEAVGKNVQHILVVLKSDRSIAISGSNNTVQAVLQNANLYASLQDTITNSIQENGQRLEPCKVYSYSPLPFSPYSPEWKGSGMMRKVLDDMVTTAGYGKYGSKLGQGTPPLGWPVDSVPWEGYTGAGRPNANTNKCLSNQQMTQTIISMLQAAQLDPATHVMHVNAQHVHPQPVHVQHHPQPVQAVNNNAVGNVDLIENFVGDEGMDIIEETVEFDMNDDGGKNLSEYVTDTDDAENEIIDDLDQGALDHNYNTAEYVNNSKETEVESTNNLKTLVALASDLSELEEVI